MDLKSIWYDLFTLFHVNVGLSDILDIAVVADVYKRQCVLPTVCATKV